jgi:ribosomal protein L37AE/L43A
MLKGMSKAELEMLVEKANRQREEKGALELGSPKLCKRCKKEKPAREFISLRRPNTAIQTCQDCQIPQNPATKNPVTPVSSAAKRQRKDSEKARKWKEMQFERSKIGAFKKAKQDGNRMCKSIAEGAMQVLDSKDR